MSSDQPANLSSASSTSRIRGVLLLILGAVAGYFAIVRPLQQAYGNAPEISMYFKFAFLSPTLALLGLLMIIFPNSEQVFLKSQNRLSLAGWFLVAVLAIIGFGTWYLLDQQIASLGYKDALFGK
jgi:hypothetical protein